MKKFIKQCAVFVASCLLASACSHKSANESSSGRPQFMITPKDLIGFARVTTNNAALSTNTAYVIHLQFTNAKAEEFRRFTREHINHQAQLLVGSKVVAEPFINAEISNGQTDLSFASSDDAHTVANLLAKTIYEMTGGGKIGNNTQPAIRVDP